MNKQIAYKAGYKYQLAKDYAMGTKLLDYDIDSPYIRLCPDGRLYIDKGYAWDGPSGMTYDSKNFMRGSLVHDALYQLMRGGFLVDRVGEGHKGGDDLANSAEARLYADQLLRQHCREDGMSWFRAWYVYRALQWFGGAAAKAANKKPTLKAP